MIDTIISCYSHNPCTPHYQDLTLVKPHFLKRHIIMARYSKKNPTPLQSLSKLSRLAQKRLHKF